MDKLDLNLATFVGIDAHTKEHTALAINRFEDEKGDLRFDNTKEGIVNFLLWLKKVEPTPSNVVVGIEGGGWERSTLLKLLTSKYQNVFEINPLFTKSRRTFGTKRDKSDKLDAKLAAEVLTKKIDKLPKILPQSLSCNILFLKKLVWYYDHTIKQATRIKNQLKPLEREKKLAIEKDHKKGISFVIKLRKKDLRSLIKTKKDLVKQFEHLVEKLGKNLTTMPGISTTTAARIIAYTGGVERFKNADSFSKYAGIAPTEISSGSSKRYIKNSKGNRKLNSCFYFVALTQIRFEPRAKKYFDKKVAEGKTKKHAIRCLMKRLAIITFGMMKKGGDYRT